MCAQQSRGRRYDLPPFVAGAEQAVVRLVDMFGPDQVHIISYMGRRMSELYGRELPRPGGFCGNTYLSPGNIHFCGTRNKWPLLERHKVTFFVDGRLDVALAMDGQADIGRVSFVLPPDAYTGPTAPFLVPTVFGPGQKGNRGPLPTIA